MLTAAIVVAALALSVALAAWVRAGSGSARLADVERDARRRTENALEELRSEIGTLRQLVAVLAGGGRLSRDQVLEGRLWGEVGPRDGLALLERGDVRVLDVRSPGETAGGVLPGALLIPIDELEARAGELPRDGRTTLVYCAMGSRSAAACEFLSQRGHTNVFNLDGGIGAWPGQRVRPGA